jgi:two-component system CheB/CheR fusion protein
LADAHDLIVHAIEIVRSEFAERELELSLHLEATRHQILADAARLQQVFWNILRNSSKFTQKGGVVSVRTHNPTRNKIVVEFSDNGAGIESPFLEKIFDAFEQAGPRRDGVGLGLAISKAIVEMHGGRICASSEGLGQGATFIVELGLNGL